MSLYRRAYICHLFFEIFKKDRICRRRLSPQVKLSTSNFKFDGAGSHKVEGGLFFAACARNNIDVAIIPASCTDEIQLMDVVVNAKFKNSLYYKWAMWMMNGPRKVQPKSGNFVAADFTTILSWCAYDWNSVKTEAILSGVEKCDMCSDLGKQFEVEP